MIEEAAAASAAVKLWSVAMAALTISTMERRCLSLSAGNNVGSIDDMYKGCPVSCCGSHPCNGGGAKDGEGSEKDRRWIDCKMCS